MKRRWAWALGALCLAAAIDLGRPLPAAWFAPVESRRVLDRDGGLLAEERVPTRGRAHWVELDALAPVVVEALLASEDDRFWIHPGLDPLAVARAARANARAGRVVQGGSTLSQQTARLLAGRRAGWLGKLEEAHAAVRLDLHRDKREVLTWYLNRVYFGDGLVGIEAAARHVFDETPAGLSTAEAALLVGVLPAPERLGPHVDPAAARRARDRVLERMVATDRLAAEDADRARAEPVELRRPRAPGLAPHFSARVLRAHGDAELRTALDPVLQRWVEEAVDQELTALTGREVDHAAVLVAEVETGLVRAYVGSGDWAARDGQVDAVRAPRSPGSALKPFLYALGFEEGLHPADVLLDEPRRWSTPHGTWAPQNYSGRFRGPVRARVALASSLNLPAVALLERVGVSDLQHRLTELGLELPEAPDTYGLGLALGDAEATLEQLVAAYAALARGGSWQPLRLLPGDPAPARQVFERDAARLVVDALSDPVARVEGFGRRSALDRGYPVAVKTGTSTGFRDNWTVGVTPSWAVGVWVGNFDGRPMGDVSGVTGAGPLWGRVMDRVTGRRAEPFPRHEGWVVHRSCDRSGLAAGPHCPHVVEERVPAGLGARPACTWHGPDCGVDVACGGPRDRAEIAFPADGTVLHVDPDAPPGERRIPLEASVGAGAREAVWQVDGRVVATVGPPFRAMWTPGGGCEHAIGLKVDGVAAEGVRVWVGGVGCLP